MYRIFQCQEIELERFPDYQDIRDYLLKYQKAKFIKGWDEFALAIPGPLREKWREICVECRRNGFISPQADTENIRWRQVISTSDRCGEPLSDMCVMCERACIIREGLESGEFKAMKNTKEGWVEPRKCWEK
jgi:hypothetical protein